jgi:hypothetical protein
MKNNRLLTFTIIALIGLMSVSGCVRNRTEPTKVQSKSAAFVVDDTGSSSNGGLPQTTDYIKAALIVSEFLSFVDVFNIGGNGKQSWEANRQHFDFPVKPVNQFNEVEAKALAKKNGCGSRLACINREVENARIQAEVVYQEEITAYNEERNNVIQKVGNAILQIPVKSPSCSDIQEQAELIAQSSSELVIWLTDGAHNCKTAFTGVEFKNKAVLIGVLPLNNEVAGSFGKRFAELSAKFPNAQVKPINSFNKQMIIDFMAR